MREWASLHRAELTEDWNLARAEAELRPIPPLEWEMLKDVVAVRPLDTYRLYLCFEDGAEGVVDLTSQLSFRGVFEPLKDLSYFQLVRVDPDFGNGGVAKWCRSGPGRPVLACHWLSHQARLCVAPIRRPPVSEVRGRGS